MNAGSRLTCVHSLTAHGAVGLRPFLTVLGGACLPVPSVLLTGPGNMRGVRRFPTDLGGLLDGTLAAIEESGGETDLLVGYLAGASQVDEVERVLERRRRAVRCLIVDPVSGDGGRPYVAPDLIAAWPRLVSRADWILPNATETELLTGRTGVEAVAAMQELAPRAGVVVTGVRDGDWVETRSHPVGGGEPHVHRQRWVAGPVSGTGDLFAAWWWRVLRLEGRSLSEAVAVAAGAVAKALSGQAGAAGAP